MKQDSILILILSLAVLVLVTMTVMVLAARQSQDPPPQAGEYTDALDQPPPAPNGTHEPNQSPLTAPEDSSPETTAPPPADTTAPTDETDPPETTAPPVTDPPPVEPGTIVHNYPGSLPYSDAVSDDWFKDALFIGDSRTQGLANLSGISSTYYCKQSLNISTAFTDRFLTDAEKNTYTILDKLKSDTPYGKIYFWFGLNDLGTDNPTPFINKYRKLINEVRAVMPDADIYVVAVVPISQKYEDNSKYGISNKRVYLFNTAISALAKELDVYFVNAAEHFADETGVLLAADANGNTLASDGAHFTKAGVKEFFAYLRTHTAP